VIIADTSVWIGHLRGDASGKVERFRELVDDGVVVLADLVAMEILQGLREEQAATVERLLGGFATVAVVSPQLVPIAARNYRHLRARGVKVHSTIDVLLATWCLEHDAALLHADRDFDLMAPHLGLKVH
jgi:hypothetical protein